jgi:hypothetical protein
MVRLRCCPGQGGAVQDHVKVVAWIHIVLGCLSILLGLGLMLFMGGIAGIIQHAAPDADARISAPIVGLVGVVLFVAVAIFSIPSILAGWGLLQYKEWARILTIILAIFGLLGFPIGTAVGIYSLGVLLNQKTIPLFQSWRPVVPQPPTMPQV